MDVIPEKKKKQDTSKNFAMSFNVKKRDDSSSDDEMFDRCKKMSFFNKDKNNVGGYTGNLPKFIEFLEGSNPDKGGDTHCKPP